VRPPSRLHTTSSIPSLHTQLQLHRGRGSLVCTCETARAFLSRISRVYVRTYIECIYIYIYIYKKISRIYVLYRDVCNNAVQFKRRRVSSGPPRVRFSRVERDPRAIDVEEFSWVFGDRAVIGDCDRRRAIARVVAMRAPQT